MARVRIARHAAGGQEGHVDSQNQPVAGCPAEWQDPFNENAYLGSPNQVG